jgi:hypothetical protein
VLVRLESYPNSTGVGAYGLKIGSGTTAGLLDTMLSLLDRDKDFLMAMESHPGDLEYIDFRFPNKIIYKFKQGGDTSVAPQVP